MSDCITKHVGLDVHKESIEIATADVAGGEIRHVGRIGGDLPALDAALARLRCPVAGMQVVYEAGPCGYAIFRHLAARAIAWKTQVRLCARFRRLSARRMLRTKAVVAIARELSGFVWAIACQEAARH